MRFEHVSIPATDPDALSDWYGRTLGVEPTGDGVDLGETTLRFEPATEPTPQHLALRTPADIDALAAWLAERVVRVGRRPRGAVRRAARRQRVVSDRASGRQRADQRDRRR
jgi:catechol 2,3-dioxygenase-like lactoylglutathione lyase family enzyme